MISKFEGSVFFPLAIEITTFFFYTFLFWNNWFLFRIKLFPIFFLSLKGTCRKFYFKHLICGKCYKVRESVELMDVICTYIFFLFFFSFCLFHFLWHPSFFADIFCFSFLFFMATRLSSIYEKAKTALSSKFRIRRLYTQKKDKTTTYN